MTQPNILTVTVAARERGCTRKTIYSAISRGALHSTKLGAITVVVRDSAWDAYKPQAKAGRPRN